MVTHKIIPDTSHINVILSCAIDDYAFKRPNQIRHKSWLSWLFHTHTDNLHILCTTSTKIYIYFIWHTRNGPQNPNMDSSLQSYLNGKFNSIRMGSKIFVAAQLRMGTTHSVYFM